MKLLYVYTMLTVLALAAFQTEDLPRPAPLVSAHATFSSTADIVRTSFGSGIVHVESYVAVSDTDQARGRLLYQVAQQGGTLWIRDAVYELNDLGNVYLPADTQLRAMNGRPWIKNDFEEITAGCCVELNNGVLVEGLKIESTCGLADQAAAIGFARTYAEGTKARIRDCDLIGKAWVVYVWGNSRHLLLDIQDSTITGGRVGIASMISTGGPGTALDLTCRNVAINIDCTRSRRFGAVYQRLAGVCARGGSAFLDGCTINVLGFQPISGYEGDPVVQTARGVWIPDGGPTLGNGNGGAARQTQVVVRNTHCRIVPRQSPSWYDAERGELHKELPDAGQITIEGGSGSAPDRSWVTKGKVEVR